MTDKSKDQLKKDRKNEKKQHAEYKNKKLDGPDRPSV